MKPRLAFFLSVFSLACLHGGAMADARITDSEDSIEFLARRIAEETGGDPLQFRNYAKRLASTLSTLTTEEQYRVLGENYLPSLEKLNAQKKKSPPPTPANEPRSAPPAENINTGQRGQPILEELAWTTPAPKPSGRNETPHGTLAVPPFSELQLATHYLFGRERPFPIPAVRYLRDESPLPDPTTHQLAARLVFDWIHGQVNSPGNPENTSPPPIATADLFLPDH